MTGTLFNSFRFPPLFFSSTSTIKHVMQKQYNIDTLGSVAPILPHRS